MEPTRLGPYTITSRLGRGGMGAVYEAVDPATGKAVAVKVLASHLADDTALRRRFHAEIDTLKNLRHPGIVQLLAFGEEEGQPYFAMELVRGKSLEHQLREGRRFTWRETVTAALAVTRALKVAHDHGIVHRDLKPANLLVPDSAGSLDGIKLADFGIAKLFASGTHTSHGSIIGTAEYMSPEQASGRPVDQRTDLYALGLVMYAMLTGRPPFRGDQPTVVIHRQRTEKPRRVGTVVGDVPPLLEELIDRLLAKDPAARPASALALGRLLAAIEVVVPEPGAAAAAAPPGGSGDGDTRNEQLVLGKPTLELPGGPADADSHTTILHHESIAGGAARPAAAAGPAATVRVRRDATLPKPGEPTAGRTPGEPAPEPLEATPVHRNRFTTVEDLERVARRQQRRVDIAQALWRWTAALALSGGTLYGFWLLFRPATADQIHARIVRVVTDPEADMRDARRDIEAFVSRFPDDPRFAEVDSKRLTLLLDALEKRLKLDLEGDPPRLKREYKAAVEKADADRAACATALDAILTVHADMLREADALPSTQLTDDMQWLLLARRTLRTIKPDVLRDKEQDLATIREKIAEATRLGGQAAQSAAAVRPSLERRRREVLEGVIRIYGDREHARPLVAEARRLLAMPPTDAPPDAPAAR
ncbi:MAG: serine/threonine-protein kinase [Planctomycetaceae bacterium]